MLCYLITFVEYSLQTSAVLKGHLANMFINHVYYSTIMSAIVVDVYNPLMLDRHSSPVVVLFYSASLQHGLCLAQLANSRLSLSLRCVLIFVHC